MPTVRCTARRCANCVHFAPQQDYPAPGWGRCALTETSSAKPEHPTTLAQAQDYDSYSASLYVAPAFGCVQFNRKA